MDILSLYLELNDPCWRFPCHLCSEKQMLFVEKLISQANEEITGQHKNFEEITGINSKRSLNINVENIKLGKLLEKYISEINFNDSYTIQRIGYVNHTFKEEKFILFLYLTFAIAEDTSTDINLIHKFNLKGFKIESIFTQWCQKFMSSNDKNPVYDSLKCFFEYGPNHYIKLNPETRSRFLERALHNTTNTNNLEFNNILKPIDTDTQGIKNLYQQKIRGN